MQINDVLQYNLGGTGQGRQRCFCAKALGNERQVLPPLHGHPSAHDSTPAYAPTPQWLRVRVRRELLPDAWEQGFRAVLQELQNSNNLGECEVNHDLGHGVGLRLQYGKLSQIIHESKAESHTLEIVFPLPTLEDLCTHFMELYTPTVGMTMIVLVEGELHEAVVTVLGEDDFVCKIGEAEVDAGVTMHANHGKTWWHKVWDSDSLSAQTKPARDKTAMAAGNDSAEDGAVGEPENAQELVIQFLAGLPGHKASKETIVDHVGEDNARKVKDVLAPSRRNHHGLGFHEDDQEYYLQGKALEIASQKKWLSNTSNSHGVAPTGKRPPVGMHKALHAAKKRVTRHTPAQAAGTPAAGAPAAAEIHGAADDKGAVAAPVSASCAIVRINDTATSRPDQGNAGTQIEMPPRSNGLFALSPDPGIPNTTENGMTVAQKIAMCNANDADAPGTSGVAPARTDAMLKLVETALANKQTLSQGYMTSLTQGKDLTDADTLNDICEKAKDLAARFRNLEENAAQINTLYHTIFQEFEAIVALHPDVMPK